MPVGQQHIYPKGKGLIPGISIFQPLGMKSFHSQMLLSVNTGTGESIVIASPAYPGYCQDDRSA